MNKDDLCRVCDSEAFLSVEERRNELALISTRLNSIQSLNLSIAREKKQIEDKIGRRPNPNQFNYSRVQQGQSNDKIKELCESKQRSLLFLKKELEDLKSLRAKTERLHNSKEAVHNDLKQRLKELSKKLYIGRLQYAMKAFDMMPIGVFISHRKYSNDFESVLHITGCSTILGIPIQNNGNYDGTPCDVIATALMHTSHLFDAVSTALHIPTVHPVTPFSSLGLSTIQPKFSLGVTDLSSISLSPITYHGPSTRSFKWQSVLSLKELKKKQQSTHRYSTSSSTNNHQEETLSSGVSGVFDAHAQIYPPSSRPPGFKSSSHPHHFNGEDRRVPVNHPRPTEDAANASINESFMDGVMLLRANILTLCLQVGVPRINLWPPQALLLNLHELQLFLLHELSSTAPLEEAEKDRRSLSLPLVFSLEQAREQQLDLDGAMVRSLVCKYAFSQSLVGAREGGDRGCDRGGCGDSLRDTGDGSGGGGGRLPLSRKSMDKLAEEEEVEAEDEEDDWVTVP